jgi:hypothetical protein
LSSPFPYAGKILAFLATWCYHMLTGLLIWKCLIMISSLHLSFMYCICISCWVIPCISKKKNIVSLHVYWHVGFAVRFARQGDGWNFDSIIESQLSVSDFLLSKYPGLTFPSYPGVPVGYMIPQVPYNNAVNYGPNGYGGRYQNNKVSVLSGLLWLLSCISLVLCGFILSVTLCTAACIQSIWVETELFYVLLLCTRKEPGRLIRVMLVCGIMLYYLFWTKSMKSHGGKLW